MIQFTLPDMTCGHCAGRVSAALRSADPACTISIDLASKTVSVQSDADHDELAQVLADAGYPAA